MLGWVVGGIGTFVVSLVFACMFLQMRCRGIGPPPARPAVGRLHLGGHGAGLRRIRPAHPGGQSRDLRRAGRTRRARRALAYQRVPAARPAPGRVGDPAAAEEPQWISDAAKYYYDQVKGRIKDRRALEELCDWRDSIVHKINVVRLINLDTAPARLHDALQKHPSTQNLRRYADDDLPRLARRLESDATNELDLFLASVYRLGYHKLLIYPFRPSVHRSPRARTPR